MSSNQDQLITDNHESVPSATAAAAASKKNKKKKNKGKSTAAVAGSSAAPTDSTGNVLSDQLAIDEPEDLDSAAAFDNTYEYQQHPYQSTGTATGIPGGQQPNMPSGAAPIFSSALPAGFDADARSVPYPALNLTHQDLLNTANELYRRMEDPGFGNDDAYWTSLPVHLRNFIRNALPLAGSLPGVAGNPSAGGMPPSSNSAVGNGQRAMYAMAQQIVSAANQGMGLAQSVGNGLVMANQTVYPGGNGAGKAPANGMPHVLNGGENAIISTCLYKSVHVD
jgi:hypothetical protein